MAIAGVLLLLLSPGAADTCALVPCKFRPDGRLAPNEVCCSPGRYGCTGLDDCCDCGSDYCSCNPPPPTPAPTPPPFPGPLPDLAASTADLSSLATALQSSGLDTDLAKPGPFTVFAPTNRAFAALPVVLTALLKPDNKDRLTELLNYHVTAGEFMSGDLSNNQQIPTLEGTNVTVTLFAGTVFINRIPPTRKSSGSYDAKVTTPDVSASNGVVHIVDKVLVPSGWGGSILDLAVAMPDLSTLVTVMTACGHDSTLRTGAVTVFAPTNAAFDALPPGMLADLLKPENKAALVDVLLYHVVQGVIFSSELTDNMQITTLSWPHCVVATVATSVKINDATVTMPDVILYNGTVALNGVVHIIDKVLIPPAVSEAPATVPKEDSDDNSSWVPYVLSGVGGICLLCGLVAFFVVRGRGSMTLANVFNKEGCNTQYTIDFPILHESEPSGPLPPTII